MIEGMPKTVANIARFVLPALCLRFMRDALCFLLARSNKTAITVFMLVLILKVQKGCNGDVDTCI